MTDAASDPWNTDPYRAIPRRRTGLSGVVIAMARVVGTLVGGVLMLLGLVLLPLPIPLGLPFLALGGFVLWRACPPVRGVARRWMAAHPGVFRRSRATLARMRPPIGRRRRPTATHHTADFSDKI